MRLRNDSVYRPHTLEPLSAAFAAAPALPLGLTFVPILPTNTSQFSLVPYRRSPCSVKIAEIPVVNIILIRQV
jgi:hypothetical protein